MTPALFALFIRSLRDDLRSRTMMWARAGMAAAVLFIMFQFSVTRAFGAAGRDFFESVVHVNALFIGIATLSYFAGAITEEKEEGTLGLLRMTDLNPLAILLGKGTSRFVGGFLILLVQFPFSLLAVTLGGLRWEQVAACYALLAALMFFGANAGLLASVLTRRTPVSAIVTACFAGLFLTGGYLAEALFGFVFGDNALAAHPTCGGVFRCWQKALVPEVLNAVLYDQTGGGWGMESFLLLVGAGCVAFLLAWLLFGRFCEEESEAPRSRSGPRWRRGFGLLAPRRRGRAPSGQRLEALVWKDYQFMHGGHRGTIAKAIFYVGAALWRLFWEYDYRSGGGFRTFDYLGALASFSFLALCAESLFAASRVFRIEKNARTLSSIAVLPYELHEWIAAKQRAVLRSLVPVGCIFTIAFVGVVGAFVGEIGDTKGEVTFYVLMFLVWAAGQVVLNLRLVASFSLWMKWGGLPLALACSFLLNCFAVMASVAVLREGSAVILPLVTWIVASCLQAPLHRNLARAAAEE